MPKGGGGRRQPLSQQRPKLAASRGASRIPAKQPKAVAKPAVARKAQPGKRPVRKVVPARKPRFTKPTPEYAGLVFDRLHALYPAAHCELDFASPYQLLVATILSAQCTDRRVNMVTPALFARYPDPRTLASARPEDVEEIIRSTGFFRAKTKSLIGMASAVTDAHAGEIPATMEQLVRLPGVGRKTANVVLGNAFQRDEGVVVDTHVARVGARLGLFRETDPVKIEAELMALYPRERWTLLSHLLIWHGRRICEARRPRCELCTLNDRCPSSLAR